MSSVAVKADIAHRPALAFRRMICSINRTAGRLQPQQSVRVSKERRLECNDFERAKVDEESTMVDEVFLSCSNDEANLLQEKDSGQ